MAAVTNTLNDIGAGIDNTDERMMTAAASAAIAALPALILQRANPASTTCSRTPCCRRETMQLATKSCEQMEGRDRQAKSLCRSHPRCPKRNDWKLQMGVGGNDATTAKDAVETSNRDNGVPWIGGQGGPDSCAGPHRRQHRQGRVQHQYESPRSRRRPGASCIGPPA